MLYAQKTYFLVEQHIELSDEMRKEASKSINNKVSIPSKLVNNHLWLQTDAYLQKYFTKQHIPALLNWTAWYRMIDDKIYHITAFKFPLFGPQKDSCYGYSSQVQEVEISKFEPQTQDIAGLSCRLAKVVHRKETIYLWLAPGRAIEGIPLFQCKHQNTAYRIIAYRYESNRDSGRILVFSDHNPQPDQFLIPEEERGYEWKIREIALASTNNALKYKVIKKKKNRFVKFKNFNVRADSSTHLLLSSVSLYDPKKITDLQLLAMRNPALEIWVFGLEENTWQHLGMQLDLKHLHYLALDPSALYKTLQIKQSEMLLLDAKEGRLIESSNPSNRNRMMYWEERIKN
jgi:hypothetical protein